jgi:hypothetical protein
LEDVVEFDLVVDGAADGGSVVVALVALIAECEVNILAVAAEPVTDSLRVVSGIKSSLLR